MICSTCNLDCTVTVERSVVVFPHSRMERFVAWFECRDCLDAERLRIEEDARDKVRDEAFRAEKLKSKRPRSQEADPGLALQ